jgi:myo-inositol-1(or 4)-monophosphatase
MSRERYKKVAIAAALKAGGYIAKHAGKIKSVRYKGEINIVTGIDRKAEEIIVTAIQRAFPGHSILAEEKTYKRKSDEYTWVIDPLDGTTNYLHGFPFFCVSIALMRKEAPLLGVVYDPSRQELFCAAPSQGAFCNRKRIRVSKTRNVNKALLATGFAYNVKKARNNNVNSFIRFLKSARAVRRAGSAALDMCYVACGRFDGFWELYLHPWDTAAAMLIVQEAGGRVSRFNGSSYSIFDRDILATNAKIHSQMSKILS